MSTDHRPSAEEFADLEAGLRRALRAGADEITPSDRLAAIQEATAQAGRPHRRRPGLLALAGIAAAAALVLTVAFTSWLPRGDLGGPAGTASSALTTTRTSSTPPPTEVGAAVPVYYLAPADGTGTGFALYRTYAHLTDAIGATPKDRVRAAIGLALAQPVWRTADVPTPWDGVTLTDAAVTGGQIVLTLSGPGALSRDAPGLGSLPPAVGRLAIQQLVWTAQAAAGLDRLPVTFRIADGSTQLFGQFPAAGPYDRPDTAGVSAEIARIWIDTPGLDARFAAGAPITVRGLAFATAEHLEWTLQGRADQQTTGAVHASGADAPGGLQFGYQFTVPGRPAGQYTLWVAERDPASGEITASASVPVTVR